MSIPIAATSLKILSICFECGDKEMTNCGFVVCGILFLELITFSILKPTKNNRD